jgi:hypothetical protein
VGVNPDVYEARTKGKKMAEIKFAPVVKKNVDVQANFKPYFVWKAKQKKSKD